LSGRGRDGAELRRERLQILMNMIRTIDLPEQKLKGVFMLRTGLTVAKIEEYIRDLVDIGIVQREGEELKLVVFKGKSVG